MLTKNFLRAQLCYMSNFYKKVPFVLTDGRTRNFSLDGNGLANCHYLDKMVSSSSNVSGIMLSTNKDIPKSSDYQAVEVIESLEYVFPSSASVNYLEEYAEAVSTFSVKNPTNSLVEVNSVYLTGQIYDNGWYYILLEHTLLETPITLQPGESKQITYTIRFNYPGTTA